MNEKKIIEISMFQKPTKPNKTNSHHIIMMISSYRPIISQINHRARSIRGLLHGVGCRQAIASIRPKKTDHKVSPARWHVNKWTVE
jgi:hypothetical protein